MSLLFNNDSWDEALKYGKRLFFQKGVTIYNQGEIKDGFYFLKKGLVKITTKTAKGDDFLLKIALPSNPFGLEAMDHLSHYTTAKTIKDSILYFFCTNHINKIMKENPAIERLFLESVIQEMNILVLKIYDDKLPARQKVARVLLNVYDEYRKYNISLKQKDIADCTGLTRITVYKVIDEFEEKGYIEKENEDIIIQNRSLLQKFTE